MGLAESGALPLKLLISLICTGFLTTAFAQSEDWTMNQRLRKYLQCDGGIVAQEVGGKELFAWNADQPLVPASVLKLCTAAFVLELLGPEYHPKTEFHYNPVSGELCVRGFGDPFLTSDELRVIADSLCSLGVVSISSLSADCRAFRGDLDIDGTGGSSNPYDAGVAALAVNFDTLVFRIREDGSVVRGEPETPLTAMARIRARREKKAGLYRVSILDGVNDGPRFALELMGEIFRERGIPTGDTFSLDQCDCDTGMVTYIHHNTKSLSEMVAAMLEYSNNLVANMLMLHASAIRLGHAPSVADGASLMSCFMEDSLGLENTTIIEASGLSRDNRISPRDVIRVLRYLQQNGWDRLLPDYQGTRAKSGTLSDVSCLGGYFTTVHDRDIVFSILLRGDIQRRDRALALLRRILE